MTEWVTIESSNIQQVKYDPRMGFLWIQFHAKAEGGTGLYQYVGVPQDVYDGLLKAPSAGKYFHSKINRQFATMKELDA